MLMNKEPRIKSVMSPFPYAIDICAPIGQARKLMLEHHVHHLPVTGANELKGIVSDRDIKLLLGPEFGSPDPHELTVEDAYVEDGYAVDLETPLAVVVRHMTEKHLGAALVTKQHRIAGIFTAEDACRVLADYLDERFNPPPEAA
jgi:acetoin utilization protein AcuB